MDQNKVVITIKRMEEALKYYQKMQSAKTADKKEYYRIGIKYLLHDNEDINKVPVVLEELKQAYEVRKAHIEKLYKEVKQIKKLRV